MFHYANAVEGWQKLDKFGRPPSAETVILRSTSLVANRTGKTVENKRREHHVDIPLDKHDTESRTV